jgi:hypothetical protein
LQTLEYGIAFGTKLTADKAMKFCSYCGKKNEDTATHCAECGTEFETVNPGDPKLADPETNLAIVATFGDTTQASLVKARLEQAGIEACIPEELDPSPFGNFTPLSHVTVRVAEKDLQAAKQVLASPAESSSAG